MTTIAQQKTYTATPDKFKQQAHAYLKAQLGMEDEQISQMLVALTQPLADTLKATEADHAKQNIAELALSAHSLKGALLNLGLNELAQIALVIEQSAKANDQRTHHKRLAFIRDNLSSLIQ